MKRLLLLQCALAIGCIDARVHPVVAPRDGGPSKQDGQGPNDGLSRADTLSPATSFVLRAVGGIDRRVCVAGDDLLACKSPSIGTTWQRLPLDQTLQTQLTGIAVAPDGTFAAVGQRDGQGVAFVGSDTPSKVVFPEGTAPLHDVASVGSLFVAVGEGQSATGSTLASAWQISSDRAEPWSAFVNGNPNARPLTAIWSDGQRVALVGPGLYVGDLQQITGPLLDGNFFDVTGLSDQSLLALSDQQLTWWQTQDRFTELPLGNDSAATWRKVAAGGPSDGNLSGAYLLAAEGVYWLASLDQPGAAPRPVRLDGVDPSEPLELNDLWVSGDVAVLVGSRLLASCRISIDATNLEPSFYCQPEGIIDAIPPPPPPPPACVEVKMEGNNLCLGFGELSAELEKQCTDQQRQLLGTLPQGLCAGQQALSWLGGNGTCCDPNSAQCQDVALGDAAGQECQTIEIWLQVGEQACRQMGLTLQGIMPLSDCGNGAFSVRNGTCCVIGAP